jgi:hypothetical protein
MFHGHPTYPEPPPTRPRPPSHHPRHPDQAVPTRSRPPRLEAPPRQPPPGAAWGREDLPRGASRSRLDTSRGRGEPQWWLPLPRHATRAGRRLAGTATRPEARACGAIHVPRNVHAGNDTSPGTCPGTCPGTYSGTCKAASGAWDQGSGRVEDLDVS